MNNSLFGSHINYPHMTIVDKILQWKPRVIKTLDFSPDLIRRYYEHIPEVTMIGRLYTPNQSLGNTISESYTIGEQIAFQILSQEVNKAHQFLNGQPLIKRWEAYNEPFPGSSDEDTHRRYDSFMSGFANVMQNEGFEPIAFNFATGNFPFDKPYMDWYASTFEIYNIIGVHEYDFPHLHRLHDFGTNKPDEPWNWFGTVPNEGDGGCWLVGRHRRWMPQVIEAFGSKEVYITELGLGQGVWPGAGDLGWRHDQDTTGQGFLTPVPPDIYFDSLVRYHNDLTLHSHYVKGCCLFVTGA